MSDRYAGSSVKAVYAIDPVSGMQLELEVDLAFSEDELRFAVTDKDDATLAQLKAMDELMAIAQGRSFEREQARVARQAYQSTLSKLELQPGQDMTPEVARAMSREITAQLLPFLIHRIMSQRGRR